VCCPWQSWRWPVKSARRGRLPSAGRGPASRSAAATRFRGGGRGPRRRRRLTGEAGAGRDHPGQRDDGSDPPAAVEGQQPGPRASRRREPKTSNRHHTAIRSGGSCSQPGPAGKEAAQRPGREVAISRRQREPDHGTGQLPPRIGARVVGPEARPMALDPPGQAPRNTDERGATTAAGRSAGSAGRRSEREVAAPMTGPGGDGARRPYSAGHHSRPAPIALWTAASRRKDAANRAHDHRRTREKLRTGTGRREATSGLPDVEAVRDEETSQQAEAARAVTVTVRSPSQVFPCNSPPNRDGPDPAGVQKKNQTGPGRSGRRTDEVRALGQLQPAQTRDATPSGKLTRKPSASSPGTRRPPIDTSGPRAAARPPSRPWSEPRRRGAPAGYEASNQPARSRQRAAPARLDQADATSMARAGGQRSRRQQREDRHAQQEASPSRSVAAGPRRTPAAPAVHDSVTFQHPRRACPGRRDRKRGRCQAGPSSR